jgi:hypothetical protein
MNYAALVDELGSIHELKSHLEDREREIRRWLVTQCGPSKAARCEGTRSVAVIRAWERCILPKLGSTDRAMLERLIEENDAWRDVTSINGKMLCKAIEGRCFEARAAEGIAAICPRVTSHTFIVRPLPGD